MLLFQQKARAGAQSTQRKLYVVSGRGDVSEELCQLLRLAGFSAVECISRRATQLSSLYIPEDASGVIIDIVDNMAVMEIVGALQMQIPRKVWCCVVGDSDSIALAQTFAHNQVGYFNLHTQQDMVIQAALASIQLKNNRSAVSISVLGCRGGAGTTTLAWQLAGEIVRLKQLPLLFVQGSAGSHDLDLLAGKKLSQEVTSLNKNLDVMSADGEHYPDIGCDADQRYNLVLFEQSIATADKELMRQLAEKTRCLVLVLDRSLSSVRVARNMIENVEMLRRSSHTPRRLFICLNDTRPLAADALSLTDIKILLGHPINIVVPYRRRSASLAQGKKRRLHSPLARLARMVLGDESASKRSMTTRLLLLLRRSY